MGSQGQVKERGGDENVGRSVNVGEVQQLHQDLLFRNPSSGSLWQTHLIISDVKKMAQSSGGRDSLLVGPTNGTKAGLRRRGGSLTA